MEKGRAIGRLVATFGDLHAAVFEGTKRLAALGRPLNQGEPLRSLPPSPVSSTPGISPEMYVLTL